MKMMFGIKNELKAKRLIVFIAASLGAVGASYLIPFLFTYISWAFPNSFPYILAMMSLVVAFFAIPRHRKEGKGNVMDSNETFKRSEGGQSEVERKKKIINRLKHRPCHGDVAMLHPRRYSQLQQTAKKVKEILASVGHECSVEISIEPNNGYGCLGIRTRSLVVRDMQAFCEATQAADIMEIDCYDDETIYIWMVFFEMFIYPEE